MLHGNSPSAACPCSRSHTDVTPASSEQTAGAALHGRSSAAAAPRPLRGPWRAPWRERLALWTIRGRQPSPGADLRPRRTAQTRRGPRPSPSLSARAPLQFRLLVTLPRPHAPAHGIPRRVSMRTCVGRAVLSRDGYRQTHTPRGAGAGDPAGGTCSKNHRPRPSHRRQDN